MNINESVPVPLAGPGLVNKSSINYGPGEYSKLTNLVITPEGSIKKRRPVIGLHGSAFNTVAPDKVVGVLGSDVLVGSYDYSTNTNKIYRSLSSNYLSGYNTTNEATVQAAMDGVTGFAAPDRHYYVQGIFTYNSKMYWIYTATNRTLSGSEYTYSRRTFIVPSNYNSNNPEQDFTSVFDGQVYPVETANWTEKYTFSSSQGPIPYLPVSSFIVHKDRVLLSIRDTVYFSKATDPTKWAVSDDGGFFKFPGKSIKKILGLGDLIYALFDNSISIATYSTSPNSDLRINLISEGVGGEDASIYGGTIYVLGYRNIYTVNGSNVSKLLDLDTFLFNPRAWQKASAHNDLINAFASTLKIEVWDDAIYFYFRYLKFGATDKSIYHVKYESDGDMFRLDLNNGSISKFTFGYGGGSYQVADSVVTIPGERNSDSRMYLVHSLTTFGNIFYFAKNQLFYPFPNFKFDDAPYFAMDSYGFGGGPSKWCCTIPIEMEIKNFSPDGLFYLYRKFRTLELQSDLPSMHDGTAFVPELELSVEAGIPSSTGGPKPFGTVKVISEVLKSIDPTNYVTSYRYGVNQRAKSIDISIRTRETIRNYYVDSLRLQAAEDGLRKIQATLMEISDITTLWTPTRKGSSNSSSERA